MNTGSMQWEQGFPVMRTEFSICRKLHRENPVLALYRHCTGLQCGHLWHTFLFLNKNETHFGWFYIQIWLMKEPLSFLYMSFDMFLLAVESCDLSQADKSIIRISSFSILQNFNFWMTKFTVIPKKLCIWHLETLLSVFLVRGKYERIENILLHKVLASVLRDKQRSSATYP